VVHVTQVVQHAKTQD